jgi:uncharacterized protein (UPF0332 family)
MTGRDFLTLARALARGATEAERRTAVSRAYYAAFHVAGDLLADLRFNVPQADRAHEFVYRRLNNSGLATVEAAAKRLHELRRRRNEADYDVRRTFAVGIEAKSVADADTILRVLDALTPAERTQITDAMKVYEQQIGDVTWRP